MGEWCARPDSAPLVTGEANRGAAESWSGGLLPFTVRGSVSHWAAWRRVLRDWLNSPMTSARDNRRRDAGSVRTQCPRGGYHYGTVLATVVLLAVCGGCADPLPAQSELLDKNGQVFRLLQRPAPGRWPLRCATLWRASYRHCSSSAFPLMRCARSACPGTVACCGTCTTCCGSQRATRCRFVVDAFEELSGAELPGEPVTSMGDRVLAWDLPAPPDYRLLKRDLFLLIEPRWAPFFEDEDSAIDWTRVGWGGVFIDDRLDATAGQICPRGASLPWTNRP